LVGMFCHRHGLRCLCDSEERIWLSKAARLDEIQALNGRLRRLPLVDFGQEWSSTSRLTSGGFRPRAVVRMRGCYDPYTLNERWNSSWKGRFGCT
jgi:hypothetical protein